MTASKFVLYNASVCPWASRAVVALAETNQEHEVIPIDLSVPRPEWYLKDINPYGQVPALKIDDKEILLESAIVAEYIADLHPEFGLIPEDALQRAQSRYFVHHYVNRTHAAFTKAAYTLDAKEQVQFYDEWIVELQKFNKLLLNAPKDKDTKGPYFLGDRFTIADLLVAPLVARLFLVEAYNNNKVPTVETHPELARFFEWREALLLRASVIKATAPKQTLIDSNRKFVKERYGN